jgi:hypothetical protein
MKFDCSIHILKPIEVVATLFKDPEALKQSQKDFVEIVHLNGVKGEAGAKSQLIYKKFDLIETIIQNNLPNSFYAKYEHKNMSNTMLCRFIAISENETKFSSEIEYTELKGFVIKLMAKLFPNLFKREVDKWLIRFKHFCEKH